MTLVVPDEPLLQLVAQVMRADDRAEVRASGGYSPLEALQASVRSSVYCRAALLDGLPLAVWGVTPISLLERSGVVWMLTTIHVEQHPLRFYQESKRELARLRERWAVLVNMVDLRYERALRWARRVGFDVGTPRVFGAESRLFCPILLEGVRRV